uniref:Ubiquitin-like domain-containing protein n=1 Tax=Ascaris lumbricoides TaxID=6252 RepID=A0A0M3I8P5_ASCLU
MSPYNRKRGVYEGKHRRRPARRILSSRRQRKSPSLSSPSSCSPDRSESVRSEDIEEAAFAETIRQLPEKLIVELPCGTIKKIADLLQSEEDDTKPIHIIVYSSDMHPRFSTTNKPIVIGRPSLRRSNSKIYSNSRTSLMRNRSYRSRRSNQSRKRPFPYY